MSGVPFHTRRACLHTRRPGLIEGQYGESRSLCKATILPAGGGAEESPRPVTRQRHKRRAALFCSKSRLSRWIFERMIVHGPLHGVMHRIVFSRRLTPSASPAKRLLPRVGASLAET